MAGVAGGSLSFLATAAVFDFAALAAFFGAAAGVFFADADFDSDAVDFVEVVLLVVDGLFPAAAPGEVPLSAARNWSSVHTMTPKACADDTTFAAADGPVTRMSVFPETAVFTIAPAFSASDVT